MMETVSLSEVGLDGRTPTFEAPYTVTVGLEAGETIPEHSHAGQDICFVVHEGELELTVGQQTETLSAGDAAAFGGEDGISVAAIEDTRALVVLSPR